MKRRITSSRDHVHTWSESRKRSPPRANLVNYINRVLTHKTSDTTIYRARVLAESGLVRDPLDRPFFDHDRAAPNSVRRWTRRISWKAQLAKIYRFSLTITACLNHLRDSVSGCDIAGNSPVQSCTIPSIPLPPPLLWLLFAVSALCLVHRATPISNNCPPRQRFRMVLLAVNSRR